MISEVEHCARVTGWVDQAGARVRDEGHVFHVELFVVPRGADGDAGTGSHAAGARPAPVPVDVRLLEELRGRIVDLDWKLEDVVVVPVTELPQEVRPSSPPPSS